ncbi:MAG TPA: glycosyltransferase family 2 protein, partial [Gaiellaceae bacterium]|nr:glycosyltransferase family 2 protein [Gaiellaceae bacterium]
MTALRVLMWGSLGLVAWTHAGYPLAAAAAARLRRYAPRRDEEFLPEVALVVAAHDEEAVIGERLENALGLDYPRERLHVVVASDGSGDGTPAAVGRFAGRGVRLLDLPRRGKVAAQNAAVRETTAEVLAFSDANSCWEPDALRLLVRNLADPEVGYVCGRLELEGTANGDSREGLYWAFELWLRRQESACGSVTAGNGGIYAVRRSAFVELGPGHSHDIGLPFRLRRRGLRSVYEPAAVAHEPTLATTRGEGARKARMLSRAWWEVLRGGLLDPRGQPPLYFAALVSHRLLRYASGPLHVVALAASAALAPRDRTARRLLAAQTGFLALALAGRFRPQLPLAGAAWYYAAVTGASVAG